MVGTVAVEVVVGLESIGGVLALLEASRVGVGVGTVTLVSVSLVFSTVFGRIPHLVAPGKIVFGRVDPRLRVDINVLIAARPPSPCVPP